MDSPDTGLGDALFPSLHPHRVTYWRLAVVVAGDTVHAKHVRGF
jgi:hypothetical protein